MMIASAFLLTSIGRSSSRNLAVVSGCVLMIVNSLACTGVGEDSANDEQIIEIEAKAQSLDSKQVDADVETRLPDEDEKQWADSKGEVTSMAEGTLLERTVSLVAGSGGEIHYIDHSERGDRTVLVTPREFIEGETPLIVSLHGFGGDSAFQSIYVPLHERVNTDGFALLLPNGQSNAQNNDKGFSEGDRFWNPTDHCCDGGKSGEDDVAYLTELMAESMTVIDFGPVYFFGYSNGGFMSHHMACKALPGLRAVASLAGTSYVEDSSCDGAPPVSVLHIHGTNDDVIRYDGAASVTNPDSDGEGERTFYASAQEMVMRWSRRAGCDWTEDNQPDESLDLDQYVPGSEIQVFRLDSGCADGVNVELWKGVGSGHSPGYDDAFVDALVDWFLAQN